MRIDPAFLATSHAVGELPLSLLRLQDDARFPWLVLLPRAEGAREIEDLPEPARVELIGEIVRAGAAVRAIGAALGRPVEKLNVGALGNIVPQLHAHVVGRRADDPAWPGPVWGFGKAEPYGAEALARALAAAKAALGIRDPRP
jgi:diadenosine tetraphosphate (Ap4A) HIT family hydrolase